MARVKTGVVTRKRRKKILKESKGYFGSKHSLFKTAKEQRMNSLAYAYRDRKNVKREYRKLWITRINATVRMCDDSMSYSKFISGLDKANIKIDRKMLSELGINDLEQFKRLVQISKENLQKEN